MKVPFSPMVTTRRVITVDRVEVEPWRREGERDLRTMRVHRSDGETITMTAVVVYDPGERKRLMEAIVGAQDDPESILRPRGESAIDPLRRRVFDRRDAAFQRVLGDLQRGYGTLPRLTHVSHEEAA